MQVCKFAFMLQWSKDAVEGGGIIAYLISVDCNVHT